MINLIVTEIEEVMFGDNFQHCVLHLRDPLPKVIGTRRWEGAILYLEEVTKVYFTGRAEVLAPMARKTKECLRIFGEGVQLDITAPIIRDGKLIRPSRVYIVNEPFK